MVLLEEHGRVAVGVRGDAPQSLLLVVVPVRAAVVPVPVPQQRREGQQAAGRRAVAPARVLAASASGPAHSIGGLRTGVAPLLPLAVQKMGSPIDGIFCSQRLQQ